MLELIRSLYLALGAHPALFAFLTPILTGELGVLFIAFFSGQGILPIEVTVPFVWLGLVAADSFWFLATRVSRLEKLFRPASLSKRYMKMVEKLSKIARNKDFLFFLISKAVIGTRVLIIAFLAVKNIKYPRFLFISILANMIWGGIVISAGLLIQKGFSQVLDVLRDAQITLSILVLMVIVLYLINRGISKLILKDREDGLPPS